jgi:hypothetical protein
MSMNKVWLIEMFDNGRWWPCADAYLDREAARLGMKTWREKCPDDKFRTVSDGRRIMQLEADLAKYQAARVHDVDEKAWLSKRMSLETALREIANAKVNSSHKHGAYRDGIILGIESCAAMAQAALPKPAQSEKACDCRHLDRGHDPECSFANRGTERG